MKEITDKKIKELFDDMKQAQISFVEGMIDKAVVEAKQETIKEAIRWVSHRNPNLSKLMEEEFKVRKND